MSSKMNLEFLKGKIEKIDKIVSIPELQYSGN